MSMFRLVRSCALALALVCTGLGACSDADSSSPSAALPTNVSAQVGTKGATLKASGMTLEIPEGALDKTLKISVRNAGQTAAKEVQAKALSDVYQYGPEGTKFKRDVTITFENKTGESKAEVYFSKEDGTGFEKIPSRNHGDHVTALVKHFSQGFLGLPLDALDAGEDDDATLGAIDAAVDDAAEPALDAAPHDAGLDAAVDKEAGIPMDGGVATDGSVPIATAVVVESRDRFGVLVNQTWAAFQDGTGAWQALAAPTTVGMYKFDVKSPSFAVAFVCSSPDVSNAWGTLKYAATSNSSLSVVTQGPPCTAGKPPVSYTLQGTLNMATPGDQYWRYGDALGASGINFSTVSPAFTLNEDYNQPTDILFATGPSSAAYAISKFVIRRDLVVTGNTTGFNPDAIKEGISPLGSALAEVLNASDTTTLDVRYLTRATEQGLWLNNALTTGTSTRAATFATLPESVRRSTDRYLVLAAEDAATAWRHLSYASYPSGNQKLTLPPPFAVTFTALPTPYLRPTYGFSPLAGASLYAFSMNYSPLRSSNYLFTIEIDPATLSANTTQAFTFPDFSQVPGFNPAWVAPSTASVGAKAAVQVAKSDAAGSFKTESGQATTLKAP